MQFSNNKIGGSKLSYQRVYLHKLVLCSTCVIPKFQTKADRFMIVTKKCSRYINRSFYLSHSLHKQLWHWSVKYCSGPCYYFIKFITLKKHRLQLIITWISCYYIGQVFLKGKITKQIQIVISTMWWVTIKRRDIIMRLLCVSPWGFVLIWQHGNLT